MNPRIFNSSLTNFNKKSFQDWQTELNSLPNEINDTQNKIEEKNKSIDQLRSDLRIYKEQNKPDEKIDMLQARINVLNAPEILKNLKDELKIKGEELADYNKSIKKLDEIIAPLNKKIQNLENSINLSKAQKTKIQLGIDIQSYDKQITELNIKLKATSTQLEKNKIKLKKKKKGLDQLQQQQSNFPIQTNPPNYDDRFDTRTEKIIKNLRNANKKLATITTQDLTKNIENIRNQCKQLKKKEDQLKKLRSDLIDKKTNSEQELKEITTHIDNLKKQNTSLFIEVGKCQKLLTESEAEVQSFKLEKKELSTQSSQKNKEISELNSLISHAQSEYSKNLIKQGEYASKSNLDELNEELKETRIIYKEVQNKKDQQIAIINNNDAELEQSNKNLKYLVYRQNLLTSNTYLMTLRDHPNQLIEELVHALKTGLNHFEKKFPINQPLKTRIFLTHIQDKINFILSTTQDQRDIYFQLCGFLWNIHDQLSENDRLLKATLLQALTSQPFDKNEVKADFKTLQKKYPEKLVFIGEQEQQSNQLEQLQYQQEYKIYQEAFNSFQTALQQYDQSSNKLKQLHHKGEAFLTAINEEVNEAKNQQNYAFDLKYHTTLLNKGTELLNHPKAVKNQTEFHNLASFNTKGTSSIIKKVSGAALALLGSVLAIAGVILGVPARGVLCGFTLFATGLSIFNSGRAKSPSKQIHQFEQAAKQADKEPAPITLLTPAFSKG